jgi:hypothetical protein
VPGHERERRRHGCRERHGRPARTRPLDGGLARGPLPDWRAEEHLALVADYEQVRRADPEASARLRAASREAFAALEHDPSLRVELDAAGDYVLTHDDPDREA